MPVEDPVFSGDQVRHDMKKKIHFYNYDTVSSEREERNDRGCAFRMPVFVCMTAMKRRILFL